MSYLAQWLSEAQADTVMSEQYLCIALRSHHAILRLSSCPIARGLAAAAIARDRDEQERLIGNPQPSNGESPC